jgi:LacI family transcriptional regulator
VSRSRVTLAEVAKLAGLSPSAASLILNNRPDTRLSQEAHDRVRAAAQALGYRPNVTARGLRTAKTATIGFVSDQVATTRFANGLIKGALLAAEDAGQVVFVVETEGDLVRKAEAVSAVLDRLVDGIIFANMRARELTIPEIPADIPVVMLNATTPEHLRSVLPDEEAGGKSAVDLLVSAGHRDKIALIGRNEDVEQDNFRSATVAKRIQGIRKAMAKHGLTFAAEESALLWEPNEGYEATQRLLRRVPTITALLCMNDRLAFGAYQALIESGRRIPEDVSVLSFDNEELAGYMRPGLTTIALPHEEMGRKAVELLLSEGLDQQVLVPMPIIERSSVAAPKLHNS